MGEVFHESRDGNPLAGWDEYGSCKVGICQYGLNGDTNICGISAVATLLPQHLYLLLDESVEYKAGGGKLVCMARMSGVSGKPKCE